MINQKSCTGDRGDKVVGSTRTRDHLMPPGLSRGSPHWKTMKTWKRAGNCGSRFSHIGTPKGYSRPPVGLGFFHPSQFCSRSLFPLLSILPLRRSSQIIAFKIVIFLHSNKFVYILNTQVLSHSARRTRLVWPLKLNHHLRQGSVFIWRNSQNVHITFHPNLQNCTARSQNQVIFKLYLTRLQIVQRTEVTSIAGVWMSNGNTHSRYPWFVYPGEFGGCDWPPVFAWRGKQIWPG
jgi:hypothetical protein